jgi:hypothetical protein
MGYFPGGGVKRQGREADHSTPFSVEVNNVGTLRPLPIKLSWPWFLIT